MGLRIGTNSISLAAQRNLGTNSAAQKNSLEKLSSGQRIYRAADDAAGLAIAEKMRAGIRSIQQNVRNANDAISLIQTAEGGLNEISNILVRFRELSIQAASDTIGDVERSFIDKEVRQLSLEVERITESTEFNGKLKLLNGQGGILDIQIGLHNDPEIDRFTVDQSKTDVRPEVLGIEGMTVATKQDAQDNLEKIDAAVSNLNEKRANFGALQNRLQSSINALMIYHENISAARSRIYDLDMASETSEQIRNNILTQSGVAVLSQANMTPMSALKLL